ncbi:MAG TPA: TIGR02302 family protein [Rhodospirillaceae bacterium]|nr:TIGR02302 family protein [Alphaproteobacteria bacterium]OUT41747.1 MAG: TIGR02302 family protein [Micavibrio sp. TMED2]HCI45957.1 TIGR02302 family protein [Rhodospirillaceae bacterium]MAS46673.1 TIGR02302 family protein [Alphaproteobacteria bacterium]MAX94768.1 TIGR02302 family protein [Alphaproteobacteria bacterium]|tara:strand:- start:9835 stop:12585 length:2751 start_codon:yes stop_codon:yes gene_type:complete
MDTKPTQPSDNPTQRLSNGARFDAQERLQKVLASIPWWRRLQAYTTLWAEALWPIASPVLTALLFWIGLAAIGAFANHPGLGLFSILALLGLGGFMAWRVRQATAWPDTRAMLRRIEGDNHLAHRPLTSLTDNLANGDDPVTKALWHRHLTRLRNTLPKRLRVEAPNTHAARRDPYALRYIAVMMAVLGIAVAGSDTLQRLGNALRLTAMDFSMSSSKLAFDAWIAPPAYTGLPPIFLTRSDLANNAMDAVADADKLIAVPDGSIVYARISGEKLDPAKPPTLHINDQDIAFEPADPGQFHLKHELALPDEAPDAEAENTDSNRLALDFTARGRDLGDWELLLLEDTPPSIVLSDTPSVSETQLIQIPYAAIDDYGLQDIVATLTLKPAVEGRDEPPVMEHVMGQAPEGRSLGRRVTTTAREDLIAHPWAGLDVSIQIAASDALGQTAESGLESLTLPMRDFQNPVALSIIEQRQLLTLKPISGPAIASEILRGIAAAPEAFNNDSVIIIGLSAVATRLELNNEPNNIAEVQQLLWELALRLEDGQLGIAQRALERAGDKLADALEEGSNIEAEELQDLIDAYEEALQEYMAALQEELMERLARGEQIPELPPGMENQIVDMQQMGDMLQQLRDLAETGARDAAREMLSQLEEMLNNMENGEFAEQTPEQKELQELAKRLQALTQEQQGLMDDTFKGRPASPLEELRNRLPEGLLPPSLFENLPPMMSEPRDSDDPDAAQSERAQRNQSRALQQEAMRLDLGDIMLDLSDVTEELPENLGLAERAMSGAAKALRENRTARALQDMGEAIEELQSLQDQLQDQANQGMAGGPGGKPGVRFGLAPSQQRRAMGTNQGYDPLGRNTSEYGQGTGSDVEVPSESEVQRARGILEELRRRSGEFDRPEEELDYIDRLLDRF